MQHQSYVVTDNIRAEVRDVPSIVADLHKARQERLGRFATAAASYKASVLPQPLISAPVIVPDPPKRREYETKNRPSSFKPLTRHILEACANEFGLSIADITGPKRTAQHCLPRFVAIGLLTEMTEISLPDIGRRLGGRDHTTILHGRRRISNLLESESFRNRFDQIKQEVRTARHSALDSVA